MGLENELSMLRMRKGGTLYMVYYNRRMGGRSGDKDKEIRKKA